MTEACSSLTFMTLYNPTKDNHYHQLFDAKKSNLSCPGGVCVGKPAPHIEVRVRVEDSLNVGRILTRGPHVMLRYWDEIPSKSSDPGWLDTGDMGQTDDCGNLWLIGRAKDRIKSGGENIYSDEVSMPNRTLFSFSHGDVEKYGAGWIFLFCLKSASLKNIIVCVIVYFFR